MSQQDSEQPTDIPHYASLAWKLLNMQPAKGKRANVRTVVDTAIVIADKEGLDALTIRRLSQELGLTTMAVYRHVASRDELLALMFDVALGVPEVCAETDQTWQDRLMAWATSLRARYQAHPWCLDVPIAGMPTTPNHLMWVERLLQSLEGSPLDTSEYLNVALLVDGHVRNISNLERSRALPGQLPTVYSLTHNYITSKDYPYFAEALKGRATSSLSKDEQPFEFGMHKIIDGIACHQ